MATCGDICRLCHDPLPQRHRRTIFTETFTVFNQLLEVLGYVPQQNDGLSKYVCGFCFTKLNKLSKIEFDILHRVETLKNEKFDLIKLLRGKYIQGLNPSIITPPVHIATASTSATGIDNTKLPKSPLTPQAQSGKRSVWHSPTPRKVKKPLLFTPQKTTVRQILPKPLTESESSKSNVATEQKRKSISISLFSPSKVKVLYRSKKNQQVKSRLLPAGNYQQIVKNISTDNSTESSRDRIGRIIYKSNLKTSVMKCTLNEVKKECSILTSRKEALSLRNINSENLTNFSLANLNMEIQRKAPVLHEIIQHVVKNSVVGTAITVAVALKHRNKHMSAFHHVIAQALDRGGATDETIDILAKLGLCVSSSAASKQKLKLIEVQKKKIAKLMLEEKEEIEKTGMNQNSNSSDIIGDNIDLTRSPSKMSVDKRRLSWHWFLLIGLQKRITDSSLDDTAPISDIKTVDNSTFIPSIDDCKSLDKNFIFHIMNVLVKYIGCLKKYQNCLMKFIPHQHLNEVAETSEFAILDVLDKSENKSEDMIAILEHIHDNYIPRTHDENPSVIKKKVFGGDVLTNERAYSAQLAMLNGETDFARLTGVVHRPEGLHRMMNLLLFIYQTFYKATSAGDKGSLSNLRNIIGRIDVHGPDEVIQKYRSHYSFMDDCLDAYIVAACKHLLKLKDRNDEPQRKQPLFDVLPDEEKYKFISTIAKDILEKYVKITNELESLSGRTEALDTQMRQLQDMYDNGANRYKCEVCRRQYKTKGGIKRHLKKEHEWDFPDPQVDSSTKDHIALYRASFMKCALLLRDTNNAFKMGDGIRILLNSKFQMLLSRVGNHTKYQLWLFRFMAYCYCLLTPRQAYEYVWNCTANLQGGCGQNIPNDNLVELLVQAVKKKIYAQGANATFASARNAALTLQVQEEITGNLEKEAQKKVTGTKRPDASKQNDILTMVDELDTARVFDYVPGREYSKFPGFVEVFSRINVPELHKWITDNRERLSYEII